MGATEERMISVNEELPKLGPLISVPVSFVVDGTIYEGTYHENGWFYSRGWMLGKRNKGEMMAQGPKAECRLQTWDELPKHKATEWDYLSPND
jgi:hypothetical protein